MVLMNTYKTFPNKMIKGKGNYLIDENGKKYLDFLSGIAVNSLGYGYNPLIKKMKIQLGQLIHCSNYFQVESQIKLANLLVKNSCLDQVFFCNSGAEANEGAIKLAKKYSVLNNKKHKNKIITFKNSFHGRTMATLSATGQNNFHNDCNPLLEGFKYAEFNNIKSVKSLIDDTICAILIEPIQGEGGINTANIEFAKELKNLCEEKKILLIFDEIQTGLGRTGNLFAYEWLGIEPDILTLAKSLGGGLPLGAFLAKNKIAKVFKPGDHGSTFGGNPVACVGGIVLLETILSDNFMKNVKKKSEYLSKGLNFLKKKYSFILEKKGKGLLTGLKLNQDGFNFVEKLYKKGIIINQTKDNTLRFIPPLIIKKNEIDILIKSLDEVFKERDN